MAYDALLYRDPNTLEFKPLLATAWKQTDDLTWELDLRQGVKFHNGDDFTSADVVFTLNFASDPASGTLSPQSANWIASTEALGPYKVRIKAKSVIPTALEFLRQVNILPAKYREAMGKDDFLASRQSERAPQVERGPANTVIFTRNEDYFSGGGKNKPYIKIWFIVLSRT